MRDDFVVGSAAAVSRIVVVCLAVLAGWFGAAYDGTVELTNSGEAEVAYTDPASPGGVAMGGIRKLGSWDGVFFTDIALNGYRFEQVHAFFPLLPALARAVALHVVKPVAFVLGWPVPLRAAVAMAGVAVSNVAHVGAAVLLYHLSCAVLAVGAGPGARTGSIKPRLPDGSRRLALTAALLFGIAPSGVFASAFYTESTFALLTFAGLLLVERARSATVAITAGTAKMWPGMLHSALFVLGGAMLLHLATWARSNGATHAGYVLFWAAEAASVVLGLGALVPAAAASPDMGLGTAQLWRDWLRPAQASSGLLLPRSVSSAGGVASGGGSASDGAMRHRRRRRAAGALETPFDSMQPSTNGSWGDGAGSGWLSKQAFAVHRLVCGCCPRVVAWHARDWVFPCIGADERAARTTSWLFDIAPTAQTHLPQSGPIPAPKPSARLAATAVAVTGVLLAALVALPAAAFSLYGHLLYCGVPSWLASLQRALPMQGALSLVMSPLVQTAQLLLGLTGIDAHVSGLLAASQLPDLGSGQPPPRPWCGGMGLGIYGFVQAEYWNIGPFNYWTVSQIPNFLLASPALCAAVCGVLWYFLGRIGRTVFGVGGMGAAAAGIQLPGALQWASTLPEGAETLLLEHAGQASPVEAPAHAPSSGDSAAAAAVSPPTASTASAASGGGACGAESWRLAATPLTPRALPYFVHWGILTVVCIVGMHIQVATRFLAACPALYWWLAVLWHWPSPREQPAYRWWILAWLLSYTVVGSILFPLFYPWT